MKKQNQLEEKLLEEVYQNYKIPKKPIFKLSGAVVRNKMNEI